MNLSRFPFGELVDTLRREFPALSRRVDGRPAVYFDGPAGTQVPQRVIDAVSNYLAHSNANEGGRFATSRETNRMMEQAHQGLADFLGADDPQCVAFGANMTTLTFALSRALARNWKPGDEVLVTSIDHDANVTPWVMAAEERGAVVKQVALHQDDCTLDVDDFRGKLSDKTKLVAVGCASNATGGTNPVVELGRLAHEVGALVFLDAVHSAPHTLIDVQQFDCDFLACSAYKFFGPHLGVLWGRRELLEQTTAYKLRPASSSPPGKWMTGTQSHEGIAGALAAVEYLADIGRTVAEDDSLDRRGALRHAMQAIVLYERSLAKRLLDGIAALDAIKVWGITDMDRLNDRLPTISITHAHRRPVEVADYLAARGVFVWHGNYYALSLTETLGLEPEGMVRIGLVHYNTEDEVDRLLEALGEM